MRSDQRISMFDYISLVYVCWEIDWIRFSLCFVSMDEVETEFAEKNIGKFIVETQEKACVL